MMVLVALFALSCLAYGSSPCLHTVVLPSVEISGEQQKPNNEETKRTKRIHDVSP